MSDSNGNGTRQLLFDKAAILSAGARRTRDVDAWGGTVRIRELSAAQVTALSDRVEKHKEQAMAIWVVASVINEANELVFTPGEDESAVMELGANDLLRIGSAVLELNGLSNIEALVKNSAAQSTASSSA